MTMMADTPDTSSYCPCGKWMNKETLISSLNVNKAASTLGKAASFARQGSAQW
jgi:hypothetical protein